MKRKGNLIRLLLGITWTILILSLASIGLSTVSHYVRLDHLFLERKSEWATSDSFLAAAQTSSSILIPTIADLPEGDLILFVTNVPPKELTAGMVQLHLEYFGLPRKIAAITCRSGERPVFFPPIPPGSTRLAAIAYYGMQPPGSFSNGRIVNSFLTIVPYSKAIEEIQDWNSFCQ